MEVQLKVDAKVGSEVQPITMIMAPVSYWSATTIGTLASPIVVSICRQPALVCDARPLLSQAQLLSHATRTESVALSVKPFKDIQDILLYEELLATDNSDD